MSSPTSIKPFKAALMVLMGLFGLWAGVVLIGRSESAFGAIGSAFFLVGGIFFLVPLAALARMKFGMSAPPPREAEWEGQPAQLIPRKDLLIPASVIALVPLGCWLVVAGVVGGMVEHWIWPVLAMPLAIYFLGVPLFIVLGRFRGGGVWVTPTRVIHEQYGVRSEINLADILDAVPLPSSDEVMVLPAEKSAIRHQRLVPRAWCGKVIPGELVIPALGIDGPCEGLAGLLREHVAAARGRHS